MLSNNLYLGKMNKTDYLLLENQTTIKFSMKTKCFQGIKQFYQNRYLNVLNPDNYIYNLETEIDKYIKEKLPGFDLKSNIIFDQKQFIQFKLNKLLEKDKDIQEESNLNLDIEIDMIKINEKTKSYQIVLKLLNIEII